ncbi:hypothetical protein D5S17_15220 [Pseudonocardiaceae bacterium YIM PH 21723]|nr:hypothetical protein D5S17_15220 [Pseudonocardiaceae bacterium YIM PH 21723]
MPDFHVLPDMIGGTAQKLLAAGQALTGDIAAFRSQTAALADAFGDDDLGSILGMIYQGISEAAFECFEDNAEGLNEIADGVKQMAATYTETESMNKTFFHTLSGGLE